MAKKFRVRRQLSGIVAPKIPAARPAPASSARSSASEARTAEGLAYLQRKSAARRAAK